MVSSTIISMDRDDGTLKFIEDGVIQASVAQKTALMSYLGTKLMYYLNHAPVPVVPDNAAANIIPMPESWWIPASSSSTRTTPASSTTKTPVWSAVATPTWSLHASTDRRSTVAGRNARPLESAIEQRPLAPGIRADTHEFHRTCTSDDRSAQTRPCAGRPAQFPTSGQGHGRASGRRFFRTAICWPSRCCEPGASSATT